MHPLVVLAATIVSLSAFPAAAQYPYPPPPACTFSIKGYEVTSVTQTWGQCVYVLGVNKSTPSRRPDGTPSRKTVYGTAHVTQTFVYLNASWVLTDTHGARTETTQERTLQCVPGNCCDISETHYFLISNQGEDEIMETSGRNRDEATYLDDQNREVEASAGVLGRIKDTASWYRFKSSQGTWSTYGKSRTESTHGSVIATSTGTNYKLDEWEVDPLKSLHQIHWAKSTFSPVNQAYDEENVHYKNVAFESVRVGEVSVVNASITHKLSRIGPHMVRASGDAHVSTSTKIENGSRLDIRRGDYLDDYHPVNASGSAPMASSVLNLAHEVDYGSGSAAFEKFARTQTFATDGLRKTYNGSLYLADGAQMFRQVKFDAGPPLVTEVDNRPATLQETTSAMSFLEYWGQHRRSSFFTP